MKEWQNILWHLFTSSKDPRRFFPSLREAGLFSRSQIFWKARKRWKFLHQQPASALFPVVVESRFQRPWFLAASFSLFIFISKWAKQSAPWKCFKAVFIIRSYLIWLSWLICTRQQTICDNSQSRNLIFLPKENIFVLINFPIFG